MGTVLRVLKEKLAPPTVRSVRNLGGSGAVLIQADQTLSALCYEVMEANREKCPTVDGSVRNQC